MSNSRNSFDNPERISFNNLDSFESSMEAKESMEQQEKKMRQLKAKLNEEKTRHSKEMDNLKKVAHLQEEKMRLELAASKAKMEEYS